MSATSPPALAAPTDDEILEMLVYAEEHGERATLENFSITRRQLCEWRAWVGARARTPEQIRALLEEGRVAEQKLDLAAFLRRHNITESEYRKHKTMLGQQGKQSGEVFKNWDTEKPGSQPIWVDEPESKPATATQDHHGDSILEGRAPGMPMSREQVNYIGQGLLNGRTGYEFRKWRIGSATLSAIRQGKHKNLSRALATQLKAANKARRASAAQLKSENNARRASEEERLLKQQPPPQVAQEPARFSDELTAAIDRVAEATLRLHQLEKENAALKEIVIKMMFKAEGIV